MGLRTFICLAVFLPAGALGIAAGGAPAPTHTPVPFMLYTCMPRQMPNGRLPEVFLATDWWIFGTSKGPNSEPSEKNCRLAAREARGRLLVLDIERQSYPYDIRTATKRQVLYTIERTKKVIRWMRSEVPQIRIAIYAMLPMRDYWTPVGGNPEKIAKWRAANEFLKPLAEYVDVICPSIYFFYPQEKGWLRYAKANIAEARRYGKPVLPFLMPQYHPSTKLGGRWVDADYWGLQLNTVREFADGAIIFVMDRVNPTLPWWRETMWFQSRLLEERVRFNRDGLASVQLMQPPKAVSPASLD